MSCPTCGGSYAHITTASGFPVFHCRVCGTLSHGRIVYPTAVMQLATRLASALKGVMEAAEFGDAEQSPPGFWAGKIEEAKNALAESEAYL